MNSRLGCITVSLGVPSSRSQGLMSSIAIAVAVGCAKCAFSAPVRPSSIISCSAGASGRVGRLALRRCPARSIMLRRTRRWQPSQFWQCTSGERTIHPNIRRRTCSGLGRGRRRRGLRRMGFHCAFESLTSRRSACSCARYTLDRRSREARNEPKASEACLGQQTRRLASRDFLLAAASVVIEGFTGRNFRSYLPITRAGTTLGRRTVHRRAHSRRFAWQPCSIFIRLQEDSGCTNSVLSRSCGCR